MAKKKKDFKVVADLSIVMKSDGETGDIELSANNGGCSYKVAILSLAGALASVLETDNGNILEAIKPFIKKAN